MRALKRGGAAMSVLRFFGIPEGDAANAPQPEPFVERRAEERKPVFHESVLTLEDFHRIRANIVNLSSRGACVHFSTRTELPFRIRVSAPTLKLNCWARVVWQHDEAAGLAFLPEEEPPAAKNQSTA